ncbi:MAG TPA: ABC transporter permease [Streptosporangiaceae bacterium]|nr:ABC transporter permease [Streptosporangiaceae bacterium]
MIRVAARWIVSSVALLFAVTALTFVLASVAPGSAVRAVVGADTSVTPQQYAQVKRQLGLDQPLPVQYWHWLYHLLHGSLGNDLFSGQPITQALGTRIAASLSIIIATVVLSGIAGVAFGTVSAIRGGVIGRVLDALAVFGFALPSFWLALVVIEVLAVQVRLFPATGYVAFSSDPWQWLRSIVLPVLTLSAGTTAAIARQTRDSMLQVFARDFVAALRSRGLPLWVIIWKHALRNAAIPVVTTLGVVFIGLLGGTVFVEQVFAIPGLGEAAVTATSNHDLPLIEGIAFYFAILVVIINLLVDISYAALNPKVRATT